MKIVDISTYSNENVSNHPLYFYGTKLFTLQHDAAEYKSNIGVYEINSGVYDKIIPEQENYSPVFLQNGLIYLYLEQSFNDCEIIGCVKILEEDYSNVKVTSFNISKSRKYSSFDDISRVVKVYLPSPEVLFIGINNENDHKLLFVDMNNNECKVMDTSIYFNTVSDISFSNIGYSKFFVFKTGDYKLPYEKKEDWKYYIKNEKSLGMIFNTYEESIIVIDKDNFDNKLKPNVDGIDFQSVEHAFRESAIDYLGTLQNKIFYLLLNFYKENEIVCFDMSNSTKTVVQCKSDNVRIIQAGSNIYYYNINEAKSVLYDFYEHNYIEYPQELGYCLGIVDNFLITENIVDSAFYIYIYDLQRQEVYKKLKGSGQIFAKNGYVVIY